MIHLYQQLFYKGEVYHMKLNKDAMKAVINYVIENQTFDFKLGTMSPIKLTDFIKSCKGNEDKEQEVACALYRCIYLDLLDSNYPDVSWGSAYIFDVTLKGFEWFENN